MDRPFQVLYAEDSPSDADLTRDFFNAQAPDFHIEIVDCGESCLKRLRHSAYDALLTNHQLADMDSIELLQKMAALQIGLPTVIVASSGYEELVIRALRAGAQDYVPKTGDYLKRLPGVLRDAIEEYRNRKATLEQPRERRRILYVEESLADIELTLKHLSEAAPHFQVDVVRSGTKALERIAQEPPVDLLVTDLRLPDMSGLDLLHEMKIRGSPVPFIVVTGRGDEDSAAIAMKLGAADYLVKREKYRTHLPDVIENAISRHELEVANRRLLESERKYRTLVEQLPVITYTAEPGPSGHWIYVSPQIQDLVGFTQEEWMSDPPRWHSLVHPDDRKRAAFEEMQLIEPGQILAMEYRILTRSGEIRWVRDQATAVRSSSTGRILMQGVLTDITAIKEAHEALRKNEERFQLVLHATNDSVWDFNLETGVHWWNEKFHPIFGYKPEEIDSTPETWLSRVHPDDLERTRAELDRFIQSKESFSVCEYRFRRADGSYAYVLDRAYAIRDANGKAVRLLGAMMDVTRRKQAEDALLRQQESQRRLEEQLRQSQKMEAVGQLAGGVAHDFNNILMAVSGYCELALTKMDQQSPFRSDIQEILKAAEKGAAVTRQLLAFGRKQVLSPKVIDMNLIIRNNENMLRRLIGEDVDLISVLEPELGRIHADPGQVEQILLNLAVNARDAMPRGGKLILRTTNETILADTAGSPAGLAPGAYVSLIVSDTGTGMNQETLQHIFEPFFTTKETGKGTGLGLATVYGIVKQSNGFVFAESEPGTGATFRIYFPRIQWEEELETPPESATPQGGTETVLLVDDNDSIRNALAFLLRTHGFTVLAAANGAEALELAQQQTGPVQILVTDVVMPGINGTDLSVHLKERFPALKTLFISGFTADDVLLKGDMPADTAFLQKPASIKNLLSKIRELLSEK